MMKFHFNNPSGEVPVEIQLVRSISGSISNLVKLTNLILQSNNLVVKYPKLFGN